MFIVGYISLVTVAVFDFNIFLYDSNSKNLPLIIYELRPKFKIDHVLVVVAISRLQTAQSGLFAQ